MTAREERPASEPATVAACRRDYEKAAAERANRRVLPTEEPRRPSGR